MNIRKTVVFDETVHFENGAQVSPATRRAVVAVVLTNPLAGQPVDTDLSPLIEISETLGEKLTRTALGILGGSDLLRAYGKAALVGTAGDLEHGAAMIHPRLGMAMRKTIQRGRCLIPGVAKVTPPGGHVDLGFGPIDEDWDLDAMDTMTLMVADAPRADEIVLCVGYMVGPRPHARSRGPDQNAVDQLVGSFS
jgi:hypothetical protein